MDQNGRVTRASHIRRPILAAGVVLGLAVGSGCLLFVKDDPSSLGTTCHVQGEGSPCGKCITKSCQPKLDACCGDATCAATLGLLDACINDFTRAACAPYADKSLSTTTRADDLRTCVTGCADICRTTSGTSVTACFASLANECVCTGGGDGLAFNDTVCNADTIPSGVCCASYGWPNTGLTCSCQTYNCRPSSNGGCTCGLGNSNTGNHSCTGESCCVEGNQCTCGPTPCSSYSKRVPSCGAAAGATCSGGIQVASCSASSGSRTAILDAGGHDG